MQLQYWYSLVEPAESSMYVDPSILIVVGGFAGHFSIYPDNKHIEILANIFRTKLHA
jgi:hypothetical protein